MIDLRDNESTASEVRDGVGGIAGEDGPLVVSISDVHGYLADARRALTAPGDHPEYDALVSMDGDGLLHWDGGDRYVLVFNGDLIDRGPDNDGVIEMVERLASEAPPGHVRVTLGNHEWGVLFPDIVEWDEWYSGQRTDEDREALCEAIADGHLTAAYDGYNFTYSHAGSASRYQASNVNDRLAAAAAELRETIGTDDDADTQYGLVEEYRRVLGLGRQGGRGFGAGLVWLDFRYMPDNAPPQIVGHTRQDRVVQKGQVVCENTIRANQGDPGGEAVLVESPDGLVALERTEDGDVTARELTLPDDVDD